MVSVALTDQESPPSYLGELRGKKKKCKLRTNPCPGQILCSSGITVTYTIFFFFPGYKHFLDVTQ